MFLIEWQSGVFALHEPLGGEREEVFKRLCEVLANDDDENCDLVTLIIRRAGEHEEA